MILILHIVIACVSILQSTYVFFRPSQLKLRTSYALVFLTVVSGSILLVLNPKSLAQVCYTGLAYLTVVFAEILFARHKLSKISKQI
jgi:hypothetical protein